MNQVVVESMLGSIVMKVELGGLVGVVMVLSTGSFPEAEEAHILAYTEGKHDSLETRRVVEERAIVGTRPFSSMMMMMMNLMMILMLILMLIIIISIHEAPNRVVLDDPGTEGIEARIGDHDHGAALEHRGAVYHIHEMEQLADVENNGDVWAIRAAGASVAAAGAALQDVAVDEGYGGLRSDVGFESRGDGVVEAEDCFVAVDPSSIACFLVEQDAAVPHHRAGGVAMA
jgi:hypothetical protein